MMTVHGFHLGLKNYEFAVGLVAAVSKGEMVEKRRPDSPLSPLTLVRGKKDNSPYVRITLPNPRP